MDGVPFIVPTNFLLLMTVAAHMKVFAFSGIEALASSFMAPLWG